MDRLEFLINYLLSETPDRKKIALPSDKAEQFKLFRSLVNIRQPKPISNEFLTVQNEFLKEKTTEKGVTDGSSLTPIRPHIYLWQGDITTLKCGGIINAANSAMLGCFCPCHGCIDNMIHTFAGVQLRLECGEIMKRQGFEEPVGRAKVTSAYNLPCDKIIHTVGPYVEVIPTEEHCGQLSSCYRECLKAAVQSGISSIALCCISTGEFHFPNEKAAEIAVKTVEEFLRSNPNIEVIFNVYKDRDFQIYSRLLERA